MAVGETTYDAVIVGAGPAGAAAAHDLARSGARVALLERETLPRYKTCGGGLLVRALHELPFEPRVRFERRCRRIELRFLDADLSFSVERPDPIVTMTMRSAFDHALVEAAREAGAAVFDGCAFEGLEPGPANLVVRSGRGKLRARFLVGADGAAGRVARCAGWTAHPRCIPALECEVEVPKSTFMNFSSAARFDFGMNRSGYAWVFPKSEHLSVGVLSMNRGESGLKALLADYLERIGIDRVIRSRTHGFLIPVRPRRAPLAQDRILLVGDAAGLADPLTAEGITYAIRSGRIAAGAILGAAERPREVSRAYRRRIASGVLPELWAGRCLAGVLYGCPRLTRRVFRSAGRRACEVFADIYQGRGSYRQLLSRPALYARLLWLVARG